MTEEKVDHKEKESEKSNSWTVYLIVFAVALIIVVAVFFINNSAEKEIINNTFVPNTPEETIKLLLHYDFETEPVLKEFKEYWDNYQLIIDTSGNENFGRLLATNRIIYPELTDEGLKGKGLKFDKEGELDVFITKLVDINSSFSLIFYFKPETNIKTRMGLNELLIIEKKEKSPFPGELKISIDKDLKIIPSNLAPAVAREGWNSMIINQDTDKVEYILNGVVIADTPRINNLNFIRFRPDYVSLDEIMIYDSALTSEEIEGISLK